MRPTFTIQVILGVSLALQACASAAVVGSAVEQRADALAAQATSEAERGRLTAAAELWVEAADQYREAGASAAAAESLREAGRIHEALGAEEQAMGLYGRAILVEDPEAADRFVALIDRTPVTRPTLSLEREASFIAAVRRMVQAAAGTSEHGERITSAEEAMDVVEALAAFLTAPIQLVSDGGPVSVQYRRWKHRRSTTVPWNTIQTDTTVSGTPAWYQFRYPIQGAGRDTVVDISCADGCLVKVPGQ